MLKETESEETIRFFVIFFIIGGISIWGGAGTLAPPLATPMGKTLEKLQLTG